MSVIFLYANYFFNNFINMFVLIYHCESTIDESLCIHIVHFVIICLDPSKKEIIQYSVFNCHYEYCVTMKNYLYLFLWSITKNHIL
jgi:hypothetical protein